MSDQLDVTTRTFTAADGTVFPLKPVPPLLLERLMNDQWGRPQPPVVETTVGGKHKRKEANPLDPDYLDALKKWEQEKHTRLLMFTITKGIDADAPEDFIEEYRHYFPGATDNDMRYLWVASHVTEEEISTLTEAIIGQSAVTNEGLELAAERFPG